MQSQRICPARVSGIGDDPTDTRSVSVLVPDYLNGGTRHER